MKPGGVTFVIDNIFRALNGRMKLHLISSDVEHNDGVSVHPVELLDYDNQIFQSVEDLDEHAMKIMEAIQSTLDLSDRCILHAHNVNLMKNTCLGRAIQFLADECPELLIIMQVHDFAEDNRPTHLDLMLNATGRHDPEFAPMLAYPMADNIVYCTINSRDRHLLSKIGIPQERIFLLPDSIDIEFYSSKPVAGLKEKLADYARNNNYTFNKNRKILCAPVRLMRRKNLVEAILILKLLNSIKDEWQLLINLDANSPKDIVCSDAIKKYIRKNRLPVVIGFGYELVSPTNVRSDPIPFNMVDVFSISDYIITTSKIEGFGMTFIEAWLQDRVVVGRKIDFLYQDFTQSGMDLRHLYDKLLVDGKDFKDYDYEKQLDMLKTIDYPKIEMKRFIEFMIEDHTDLIKRNRDAVMNCYSLESYRTRLLQIIDKGLMKEKGKYQIDNAYLIDYFKNEGSDI